MADPSQVWQLNPWDVVKSVVPPITAVVGVILGAIVFWLKQRADRFKESRPAPAYRIYPDHNRWSRTEIIATAGLLVALLGLIISLLRR